MAQRAKADLDAVPRASCRSQDGRTPLHKAVYKGKVECVKVLVEAGANIEAKDYVSPSPTPLSSRARAQGWRGA